MDRLYKIFKSRLFWLVLGVGGLVLLYHFTPVKLLLDQSFLTACLHMLGYSAVPAFIVLYGCATVIGIPGAVLTVAGGVVFGLIWGTIWSVIGATLGAVGAFWVARYLLHDWIQKRFGHHKALIRLKQSVNRDPFTFVLAIRFAPISPFNLVNFLFGLTPINIKPYALGTFLGIIPGTLAYTWLGVTATDAMHGHDPISFWLALGLLALLSVIPLWARRS